jgi:iron complex outermembrane receptor protein
VPASIDRVDADDIRFARPMVNLSESLNRVPGISVQNRQNYAQDLQISSRGFGGRATFGIRGLRLITDGIPASFPDGQGQVSHFDLQSARSIEVLRGPFAVMYGNASGGVINVVTEGGLPPAAEADFAFGSYGMYRMGAKLGGAVAGGDGIASIARFHTDGYRDHSAADREQGNAKLSLPLAGGNLTVIANTFASPAQDPLGLTRAQMNVDPRQVTAVALQFNTRKSAAQSQMGAAYDTRIAGWSLNVSAYGGDRGVRQYLAIPVATQLAASHSGGVVDLDRGYGGLSLRLARDFDLGGRPLTLSFGGDYETFTERRKGFLNLNGDIGGLKRDEDDYVAQSGAWAQAEWRFAERWSAVAGVRSSGVKFKVSDYFIVPGNGNDSGRKNYGATTPSAGLLYSLLPTTSLYAAAGRGFETPTNAELAYRLTGSGPNFDLKASTSRHLELGAKSIIAERLRLNAALFDIRTDDEIAIESNAGGRSTFKNVGHTSRKGVELGASATLPWGLEALAAWTRLEAKFLDRFTTVANTPAVTVTVPAGNYLPGVPRAAFYGELRWSHAASGFTGALEYLHKSRVWADDRNSEAADSYGIFSLAGSFVQNAGGWRFTEYLRVDNVGDKRYAGSVVVNDANLRFYEPAPGRNYVAGLQARYRF